ncbi:MAG: glucose dehydrogenase, partial [Verrucomicrobiota bacterium]
DYVDFAAASTASITWTVKRAAAGPCRLGFYYACTENRPLKVVANGTVVAERLDFPSTGSWTTWKNRVVEADLVKGANSIQLIAIGQSGGNFDFLRVLPRE